MSQHYITNIRNRKVLYGSDKPTGGFFFTEFLNDWEITSDEQDEVVSQESSLTITELINYFFREQGYELSKTEIKTLLEEWKKEPEPTPLQFFMNDRFGKNLQSRLDATNRDINNNWSNVTWYFPFGEKNEI